MWDSIMCYFGFHKWSDVKWKMAYDREGCITGYHYRECDRVGCFKCQCVFNYETSPGKDKK